MVAVFSHLSVHAVVCGAQDSDFLANDASVVVLLNAVVIVGRGGVLGPSCRVGTFAGPSDSFAPTE